MSRVLSHPSWDSRLSTLVFVSEGVAPVDPRTANALVAMQSNFDVDSTVMTRRLVEVRKNYFIPPEYELHAPLPGERPYDVFSNGFNLSTDAFKAGLRFPLHRGVKDMNEAWLAEAGLKPAPREMFNLGKMKSGAGVGNRSVATPTIGVSASTTTVESLAEKCPSIDEGLSLRKRNQRETPEHQVDALGSTTRVPSEKGKEPVAMEEAPKRGYTLRELCEVEDCVGVERYFATVKTRLKVAEGEDPLMPRWSAIVGSSQFWIEGPLCGEYLRGVLHPNLAKQSYECSSEELMKRASKSAVRRRRLKEEVGILRSSLDGARNDRAYLEEDVLSLIEAMTLLKAELKGKGAKTVAAYKASRGFESGLEKVGWVNYEFGYWVALERLWGKHPKIEVEQDPFIECPKDANVKMDLS
ncbi:hypothetical protein B296_00028431 [Ensete ventricosum]|uniref:Uncharacterized protein n=1 Tax=Ensete ventricosum TaxID=4639 RepID=A0A427A1D3_ENSVE|nr:hypothetical protein B296_00028431 [Ensete ventricosum]